MEHKELELGDLLSLNSSHGTIATYAVREMASKLTFNFLKS